MFRQAMAMIVLAACLGCGGKGSGGVGTPTTPSTPTRTVTSVAVSYPGGTIFIAAQTQFQATSTFSDGTTQVASKTGSFSFPTRLSFRRSKASTFWCEAGVCGRISHRG